MKVWPKDATMRRLLKHPNGVKFRADGPISWPDDSYTFRAIQDGDVLTSDPSSPASKHKTEQRKPPTGQPASQPVQPSQVKET